MATLPKQYCDGNSPKQYSDGHSPQTVLKSVVSGPRVDKVAGAQLLQVTQSLNLRGVNDFHHQRVELHVTMHWVIEHLRARKQQIGTDTQITSPNSSYWPFFLLSAGMRALAHKSQVHDQTC